MNYQNANKELRYDYIVIEGNIGTGKTSLATKIAEDFNTKLILERFADNPFLPLFYQEPKRYAFPLELSFLADRYQQLNDELKPVELFKQKTVADYVLSKSLIFAANTLKEDEYKLYQRLFHIMHPSLPKPDLLVYLHKNVSNLKKNIAHRGRSYEQNITDEYLLQLDQGYWNYFKQNPGLRILVIDTDEVDFIANPNHFHKIVSLINHMYAPGIHRKFVKNADF